MRASILVLIVPLLSAADEKPAAPAPAPPIARIVPKTITMHGDTRVDNYFWLREKTKPEVIQYLEAENKYTEAMLKPIEALQQALYKEMIGRIKQTDLSVPARRDDYYYYTRTEEGKQYPIYYRRKGSLAASEEILLDQNELAKGHSFLRVGKVAVSPNHVLLAYTTDYKGDEAYTLHIKNLEAGADLPDEIPEVYSGLVWAADNKTIFYTKFDSARRADRVFRHPLGGKASDDALVYHEKDDKFEVRVSKTRSQEYLIIDTNSIVTSEVRYLRADRPDGEFRVIEPRRQDIAYLADHLGNSFYILVNDTGKNYRLVKTPVSNPVRANWQEVLAHRAGVMIDDIDAFRDHLVITEMVRGLRTLRILKTANGKIHYIRLPESVGTASVGENPEYNTNILRFSYTSLVTPMSIFDYDMDARKSMLKKRTEVGDYDPRKYITVRVYASAPDGAEVPVSMVYRKGLARNGSNPTLLYGYGSYGSITNTQPAFRSELLSLIDRGWVFAIAHVRGGGDFGVKWHDDGKLLKKKNTFTDFIAAAEKLVKDKYTSADKLAISSASAGGLLMGAVANMRPDLFKAVVAGVPFVDVLNTATDPSLPMTISEYEEWGDPNQKQFYDYFKSYSPYDNVSKQVYPNMLITAGLNDTRVSYWEPAKWTAKLRAMNTGKNLLLFKINMEAGHSGASGRYDRVQQAALQYAFLLHVLRRD